MADLPKGVRVAARALSDAITAAERGGYVITPTSLSRLLPGVAVSETSAVAPPEPIAPAAPKPSPAPGKAPATADA